MATLSVSNISSTTTQFSFGGLQYKWDTVQYLHAFVDLPGPAIYPPVPPGEITDCSVNLPAVAPPKKAHCN